MIGTAGPDLWQDCPLVGMGRDCFASLAMTMRSLRGAQRRSNLAAGAKAGGRATPMTTSIQPLSKTLTVNGLALHYLEWGKENAPPIVCVHGYTGSADAFNALARHLQDRYHLLALDVRGHGESAWSPAGAYRYEDQADDLAGFADRLGLQKFALIGTSMGGIIAMAYAAEHGD